MHLSTPSQPRSRNAHLAKRIALVACWAVTLAGHTCLAQTKSIRVRGEQFQLQVATDQLFVRTAPNVKSADVAADVLRVQAELLELDKSLLKLAAIEAKPVSLLGGFLVPRLPGLKDADLAAVAARSPLIESAETVYRAGRQLVIPSGTITVRFAFREQPPARVLFALGEELGLKEVARPKYASGVVRFQPIKDQADLFQLCEQLLMRDFVRWAEPDLVVELDYVRPAIDTRAAIPRIATPAVDPSRPDLLPNDPLFSQQWHLANGDVGIRAPAAWSISTGKVDVRVAVVDTGMDLDHVDLRDRLLDGYDFVDDDDHPFSRQNAHATACAGLIGASSDNRIGVAGVAWRCKIMPVRMAPDDGFGTRWATAEAIAFAARNNVKIISCSIGSPWPSNQEFDAIDEATNAGCLIFAASGNHNPEFPEIDNPRVEFPAAYEKCIAVGAVRYDNKRCNYSNWGPALDLVAPGGFGGENSPGIWTTDCTGKDGYNAGATDGGDQAVDEPGGDYTGQFDGTSAATPIAAGVAALVWSSFPDLSPEQVRQCLLETATKIDRENPYWRNGHNIYYGYGKVDAYAAMQRAREMNSSQASP